MKKLLPIIFLVLILSTIESSAKKSPIDYVNPFMGNISHLLVPTYPTVHLPNSMMRLHPQQDDYTSDRIKGLPLFVNRHRRQFTFNMSPIQGSIDNAKEVVLFTYDHTKINPYSYSLLLDEKNTQVECAVSHQSAIYEIAFSQNEPTFLTFNSVKGKLSVEGNVVKGYEVGRADTKIYIYVELDKSPLEIGVRLKNQYAKGVQTAQGENACVVLSYGNTPQLIKIRYGVSFIDEEQAKANLYREQKGFDLKKIKAEGRATWEKALSVVKIDGLDENQKTVFYTSLYRTFERPIALSEDGRYYSYADQKVHDDNDRTFFTDDWIWDTYLASHPLRTIIQPQVEQDILNSYILLAGQKPEGRQWMPTFPGPNGDYVSMNCNHAVGSVLDAWNKGLRNYDLTKAYNACRGAVEDKTLIPWSESPARNDYDGFYKQNGFLPALHPGEKETMKEVSEWELRQTVAVTLGTSYDHWCLSEIARTLNKKDDVKLFFDRSFNYRNLFNPVTKFFHPKDSNGLFIPNLDYQYSGGRGGRAYYAENNGYTYRWDVKHNVKDLIQLMGGKDMFCSRLDSLFSTKLGSSYKLNYYTSFGGDQTGNVGQFSMGNEPGFHIPYLYNYAGQPWKTQKRVRSLIDQWFRNDLMGIPGDEDGGAMSAFAVFSMIGFYPVTPGVPVYSIGSPHFTNVKITLENGKVFEVVALKCSRENKYIQSATLNGKALTIPFIQHADMANGGKLVFVMGSMPNKQWGIDTKAINELHISAEEY